MNVRQYQDVLNAYNAVQEAECTQSRRSGGYHYLLVRAMRAARINVSGMGNQNLMREAEKVIRCTGRYGK